MHNRGNGKGGGVATVGLSAQSLGVTQEVLDTHYLLQIALLQPEARPDVEAACINPCLEVHKAERIPTVMTTGMWKGWRYSRLMYGAIL